LAFDDQEANMTTTATPALPHPAPNRFRRNLIVTVAGAAIVATASVAVSRVGNDESPASVSPAAESTLDVTLMNGAFWGAAPSPSTLDVTLMNGAFSAAAPLETAVPDGQIG
jgi:hypothetical protein